MAKYLHNFKKEYGQNFFRGITWPLKILETAGIDKTDNVLEVGPGEGSITEFLTERAKRVIAVEIDAELCTYLAERFQLATNFTVTNADFLELELAGIFDGEPYKFVSALPYNVSKPIIKKLLESSNPPTSITVVLQKEVAEDYAAAPPKMKFLGVASQLVADIDYVDTIPRNAFYPEPKVDGAILHFTNIKKNMYLEQRELLKFIKAAFVSPRKKLSKNLSNNGFSKEGVEAQLVKLGLTATARAGELSIAHWKGLFEYTQ